MLPYSAEAHRMSACTITLSIRRHIFLSLLPLILLPLFFIPTADCQILESCSAASNCGAGLYCGNCASLGKTQPFCIRGQATIPTSIISGLPFNKYSWLMTHNAFSIVDEPSLTGAQRITFYNQEDSNGVRGLMLDMYDFENDIWLCHSFRGQCYNFTAFQPAINTLREVEAFLTQNPSEIVTIIIEDYVHAPKGLTKVFSDAGLDKYWYPVAKMPKKGADWPTVNSMVQNNYRLLVFTSDSSKEATEGIAYQWKYMVENEPGDPGVVPGSCPNRKESKSLSSKSASLFLMNYFPTIPVQNEVCREHSAPLADMVATCYKSAGNLMPNFIAVNFYMRSDGGGVFDDLDRMNGQTLCGCSTLTACQVTSYFLLGIGIAGAPSGSCKTIPASNMPPNATGTSGSFSGSVQLTGDASALNVPGILVLFLLSFLVTSSLLS
ncbi:hypothetical protein BUALT_Bualt04G0110100 [Buddleja alternifolia]|uniref:PLC-like phosphodiesterase n=1 Tax=Buddleja alternifolia TaxID=168488 RepID=A0AAV6XUS0_9LAMI|nr:hypothetical protein BUALT_Bualt04G0110100 [Buddleja alternifolia]